MAGPHLTNCSPNQLASHKADPDAPAPPAYARPSRQRKRQPWQRVAPPPPPSPTTGVSWVTPAVHFVRGEAEDTWVRSTLVDGAWHTWLGNVAAVLRVPIVWVENCLLRLVSWGVEFARDLGVPIFLSELRRAQDLLEPKVWLSILHDSTSPRAVLLHLHEQLLRRGLGDVGCIPIQQRIWDSIVPEDFHSVA